MDITSSIDNVSIETITAQEVENTETTDNQTAGESTSTRKKMIPDKVPALIATCERVYKNWLESPISLVNLTKEQFAQTIKKLQDEYNNQAQAKNPRSLVSVKLSYVKKQSAEGIAKVKYYLHSKFPKKESFAIFPEFGIIHNKNAYSLPVDISGLYQSLNKIITALPKYELTDMEYGSDFWTNLRDEMKTLVDTTANLTVGTSKATGNLNTYKEEAKKQLKCIAKLIEAEYPDDPERALRNFGFFREN